MPSRCHHRLGTPAFRLIHDPRTAIVTGASFLISDEAGFVSGQVIYVAGGPVD
jgi:hypothetical protein